MHSIPKKKGSVYTEAITIRVEPELHERLALVRVKARDIDVTEAIRIAIRELAERLEREAQAS